MLLHTKSGFTIEHYLERAWGLALKVKTFLEPLFRLKNLIFAKI